MLIVDAHLDLAYNAVRGRNLLLPADQQIPDEDGIPSVGLPDLREGHVGLVCGTLFCEPARPNKPGYRTSQEAYDQATQQLRWYLRQFDDRTMWPVTNGPQMPQGEMTSPGVILLMEGADPLRTPADVPYFVSAGVRIVGLAWRQTRYAGGTGAPGMLTPEGVEIVRVLDQFGVIHDTSHLAEQSFWQLLDISGGPMIASHSNCRAIVPTDRQLSDEMIRTIAGRGGVIGINFFDRFLIPPEEVGTRRANLNDVVHHIDHMCQVIGNDEHVGLGTDMDGGLGREQIPVEIRSSADLPKLGEALLHRGYVPAAVERILGGNWLSFFRRTLRR